MKSLPIALFALATILTVAGCGGSVEEQAPPTSAPEMTEAEKANYEKQMEMMKQQRSSKK